MRPIARVALKGEPRGDNLSLPGPNVRDLIEIIRVRFTLCWLAFEFFPVILLVSYVPKGASPFVIALDEPIDLFDGGVNRSYLCGSGRRWLRRLSGHQG